MSRHKIVRNMDLEDELDDFDGGEDYDDYGGDIGSSPHEIYIGGCNLREMCL